VHSVLPHVPSAHLYIPAKSDHLDTRMPTTQHDAIVEILRNYRQLGNVGERRARGLTDILTELMRLVKLKSLRLEDHEEAGTIMDMMQEARPPLSN
jgi:hypothetical protein